MKAAVVGYGYWGKNIARVFSQSHDFELDTICDQNAEALDRASRLYPHVKTCSRPDEIADDVEVVAVIVPVDQHFPVAKELVERGKHVLLTKPFVKNYGQAEELMALAEAKGVTLFVDHTFVFNPAVRKMKEMLPKIGKPQFVLSQRLNLGLYQPDVNVIYDLMPHDLSIIAYLFDAGIDSSKTYQIKAMGLPQEDLAHSSFTLDNGVSGLVTVSWLSPFKVRQFFVVGTDGMLSYDDVLVSEKVRYFDKGLSVEELSNPQSRQAYTSRISYRSGDLYAPAIPNTEALAFELTEFKKSIEDKSTRDYYSKMAMDTMRSLEKVLQGTS